MPETQDYITLDHLSRPRGGVRRWRRALRRVLADRPAGLRSVLINNSNFGTFTKIPKLLPANGALVMAWDDADVAAAAFAGPLGDLVDEPGRFRVDGEVTRVRLENPGDTWHGWLPCAEGAAPITRDEPLIVVVHGILHPRHLGTFANDNIDAASRARHHPGHRGSIDVASKFPFEHTSISLWKTHALAMDYAYKPGGHKPAMQRTKDETTHKTGLFLQVRPLASSGNLGINEPAFPNLPPVTRR
ncbi:MULTISPECIES: hypothetical protein [Nocardiaceae]|uniref:hypothetical protein n=1 Tax=Nocardiaceae TaxID=85025 RepID=UPI000A6AE6F2|nr:MULTISPECIES: hypothetical protein [Rhodococcus]